MNMSREWGRIDCLNMTWYPTGWETKTTLKDRIRKMMEEIELTEEDRREREREREREN